MIQPRRRLLLQCALVATALAACRPAADDRGPPAAATGTRAPPAGPTTTAAVETNAVMKTETKSASTKPAKLEIGVLVNVREFVATGD